MAPALFWHGDLRDGGRAMIVEMLHSLHLPTLMVSFTAISLVLGITMSVYWLRQRALPGLGHWTLSIIFCSVGVAFLIARVVIPLWISVLFGNLLVFAGTAFAYIGIRRFGGLSSGWLVPAWSIGLAMAIMMYDLYTRDDIVFRATIGGIWLTIGFTACAVECWRMGRQVARRLWVLPTLVFSCLALMQVARTYQLLVDPVAVSPFLTSPAQAASFLSATVSVVAAAIAMMGLSNEWLQQRLQVEAAEHARVARERDRAAQAALAANRAKSMFLATISHEIRNPVNAVMGGLELLRTQRGDQGEARVLSVMGTAGQTLLGLLEDMLDISRIEAGHLSLSPQPLDLHQLLRDAVDLMAGRATAAGLTLGLGIANDLPRHVVADAGRLRQILLNLIGNAVKFTEQGGVSVTASLLPPARNQPPTTAGIRIIVADTGIGIAADKLPHVFEAFFQAETGETRRFGGVGLGLAICRRLVDLMDGRIDVESEPGHGTVFTLDLPVPLAPPPQAALAVRRLPYWSSKPTILLVEDDAVNRFVATQLLTRQGLEVLVAADGLQALMMLGEHHVAAVLMDIGMPGIDGFETTERLRNGGGPMAGVPVLALTANVLPETVARSRAVGMQGFVAKPIRLEELLTALSRLVAPDELRGVDESGGVRWAGNDEPLAGLRGLLAPAALEELRAMAAESVAAARERLTSPGLTGRRAARILLRTADAIDSVGLAADGEALRECLPLLGGETPASGSALAAADGILAAVQGRLARAMMPLTGTA